MEFADSDCLFIPFITFFLYFLIKFTFAVYQLAHDQVCLQKEYVQDEENQYTNTLPLYPTS